MIKKNIHINYADNTNPNCVDLYISYPSTVFKTVRPKPPVLYFSTKVKNDIAISLHAYTPSNGKNRSLSYFCISQDIPPSSNIIINYVAGLHEMGCSTSIEINDISAELSK